MAKIEDLSTFSEDSPKPRSKELVIPAHVEEVLRQHPQAWENFCNMSPSNQRVYIGWITDAKRAETIDRRLQKAIERLEQNLPLGMV